MRESLLNEIFFPVLLAILVGAAIIFGVKECNDEQLKVAERQERVERLTRESAAISAIYSTPKPTARPQANTRSGAAAVIITKAVRVNIPRGEVIIRQGSKLKVVSKTENQVYVDYDGYSVPVPLAVTSEFEQP